jgi:flagellar protein FliS
MNPALRVYRTIEVSTSDRGRLLLAMFEGALSFLKRAQAHHGHGDLERFSHFLRRAQDVVTELATTLDRERGGEIAVALERLYDFMIFRLSEANIERSTAPLADVIRCLRPVYAAYRDVVQHPTPEVAALLRVAAGTS